MTMCAAFWSHYAQSFSEVAQFSLCVGGGGGRDLDCKSNSKIMKTWTKSIVSHDTICTSP